MNGYHLLRNSVRKTVYNYRALRSRDFFSSGDADNIASKWRNSIMMDYIFRTSPDNELKMCLNNW